jgi:hypothetical protein
MANTSHAAGLFRSGSRCLGGIEYSGLADSLSRKVISY